MNFKRILTLLKKNILFICVLTMTMLVCMSTYLYFATPVYENTVQLLINQTPVTKDGLNKQAIETDLQLTDTYTTIIKSPRILTLVKKKLNSKYTLDELSNMVSVENKTNSQIISILVKNESKQLAADIANEIATVTKAEIPKIMKINNVTTLSPALATENQKPVAPKKAFLLILAAAFGIVASVTFILIKEMLNRKINTTNDITELLDVPVMGMIGSIANNDVKSKQRKKK